MAINEWGIWKRMGLSKEEIAEVHPKEDIDAIISFLKDFRAEPLIAKLEKMKSLLKEEEVIRAELKEDNLKKQVKEFEGILEEYSFLENDTDINGIRLRKKIGQNLITKLKPAGLTNILKKKNLNWR